MLNNRYALIIAICRALYTGRHPFSNPFYASRS